MSEKLIEEKFDVKILEMEDGDVQGVTERTVGLRKYIPASEGLEIESASMSMFSEKDAEKLEKGEVSLEDLDADKYREFSALQISTAFNNLSKDEALNLETNDFNKLRQEAMSVLGGGGKNFQSSGSQTDS